MKKTVIITSVILILIFAILLAWLNRSGYEIHEDVSSTEITPLDGVNFEINADKKNGSIQIENNTAHYIVVDFHSHPLHLEIQKEDGWHQLLSTKMIFLPAEPISENETYSLDFKWKYFIGGSLKPGNYRAILFYGDGVSEIFYSTAAEFRVE